MAVHTGYIDTDMAAAVTDPKIAPGTVANATLEAIQNVQPEVLVDEPARYVRAALSGPLKDLYPSLA